MEKSRLTMSQDIDAALKGWDFKSGVVQARLVQAGEGRQELAVIAAGMSRIDKAKAVRLVMVVEKRNEEPARLAVRADDPLLDAFA